VATQLTRSRLKNATIQTLHIALAHMEEILDDRTARLRDRPSQQNPESQAQKGSQGYDRDVGLMVPATQRMSIDAMPSRLRPLPIPVRLRDRPGPD
jgi:hypothetical protein